MSLHPLAQLGQVALALGLGAALGLLFDMLRVPRRHARRAFLRAVLDAVFCLAVGLTVFAFGMAAGSGQVRLFMFLAIAAGWTGYFAWVSGQVLPPLEQFSRRCAQKTRQFAAPGQKFAKKVWIFAKKRFQNRRRCFRIDCITGSRYDPGEVLQTVKFKKASIFTTLVIAVLMVYALISLFVVHRQTRQLQDRAATLQQQVSEMTQANAELQYQIDHSEDDDMIESVAREKLGLVKPGEKIFYDTSD